MEALIKIRDFLVPYHIALGHLIKLVLHLGSEVVVHDRGEILHQELVYDHAHIGGNEFSLLDPEQLALLAGTDFSSFEGDDFTIAFVAFLLSLLDILALLDCGNDGRIG